MTIRDLLINSEFYKKLFKYDPSLDGSFLTEILIADTCFVMSIDLENVSPDFLPREWHGRQYNTTRLRFCFFSFDNLIVRGFVSSMRGTLNLEKKPDSGFRARFASEFGSVELESDFVAISAVDIYFSQKNNKVGHP